MMKKKLFVLCFSCSLLLTSCLVSKKVVYVDDMEPHTFYPAMEAPLIRVQSNDRLSIVVGSKSPELAVPFNQGVGSYQINEMGELTTNYLQGSEPAGYLVDRNGEIDFPILGTLKVQGLTLDEVKEMIKSSLRDSQLIGDALVRVELLNLKVNMMGEIGSIGVLAVPEAKITLLEAISRSGGVSTNAATNEIAVIREEEGARKMYLANIESVDIFESPVYYLKQNDIVYVKPKDAVQSTKEANTWRYLGLGVGLLGTITLILNLLK